MTYWTNWLKNSDMDLTKIREDFSSNLMKLDELNRQLMEQISGNLHRMSTWQYVEIWNFPFGLQTKIIRSFSEQK